MRLLDSNIVIYATQPDNDWLRSEVASRPFAVSQATRVEVLGWHQITPDERRCQALFRLCPQHEAKTVQLRDVD